MKKQQITSLFKGKGFYTAAIILFSLLLAADVVIGLLPTSPVQTSGGFPQGTAMPQLSNGMQMPGGMGNLPGMTEGNLLQTLRRIWIPAAGVLALLDALCIFVRLRKREIPKQQVLPGDGEVHLAPKKQTARRHSPWWGIAPVAGMLALAVVAQLFGSAAAPETPRTEASIHSAAAERKDLDITLPGSGTLTEETAEAVSLVSGVEISSWYVSDGDAVSAGDALAALDRVSVMVAIATVQDTIEELDDALSDWENDTLSSTLTAPTAGRIKEIYIKAGDDVTDVMYEYGALMRISMDGMMAVAIETDAELAAGDAVAVTLADGTAGTGRVESVIGGTVVVTLTDAGTQRGDTVTVSTEAGAVLGSGSLYIHSELKVTAYTGTVKSVPVREEQEISSGRVLVYLSDREDVASYESLLQQRGKLEEQMAQLFQLYQTTTLFAPCDGVVSGVEEYTAANLSADSGAKLMLLANAPGDDPDGVYVNFIGKVTSVEDGAWQVSLSPESWDITDYAQLEQLQISESMLTESITYTPSTAPVYTRSGESWISVPAAQVQAGSLLLFAFDPADTSRLVWIVVIGGASDVPPDEPEPTEPDSTEPTEPDTTEPSRPGSSGQGQMPSGSGSGMSGGFGSGSVQEVPVVYEVPQTQVLSITPQNTMSLTITVDELDILALQVGQSVQTTLDAMPGQSFEGVVTELGLSGSNSGGNSKFTAVIQIPRMEWMLPGMNASVSVMLESHENLVTVSADALVERDGKVYLYTSCDAETDTLGGLVEVTTGLSDGRNVQILSGISEGETYYYSYLDTVNFETSAARSTGSGFSFGRMR